MNRQYVIIGSTAIKHWFPDFKREPKDLDVIGNYERKDIKVECLENPVLRDYQGEYLSPDLLYTLKMSHIFWDINWEKHIFDLQFLKSKGCKLNKGIFFKLYDYWNEYHRRNRRSDLKMNAAQFFNNALTCEWDHDWLHTLIKEYPTFNKILKEGEEVEVDEVKFNSLSESEKEDLVREEIYVMAFERMPNLGYKHAYGRMLKKFIISHAPIWEAIWIIENYVNLCTTNFDFIKFLKEKIHEKGSDCIRRSTGSLKKQKKV